jgi:hypothetical protein
MSDVGFVWRISHIPYKPLPVSIGANAMGEWRSTLVKDNASRTTDRARSGHKPNFEKKNWLNALVGNKTTDFSLLQLPDRKLSSALLGWRGKYKEYTMARHHVRLCPSECIGWVEYGGNWILRYSVASIKRGQDLIPSVSDPDLSLYITPMRVQHRLVQAPFD